MAGKVIREFRNATDGMKQEFTDSMNEVVPPPTKPEEVVKEEKKEVKPDESVKKE